MATRGLQVPVPVSRRRPALLGIATALVGALALLLGAGCVDGTTPSCGPEAGCGPGIEAGPEVSTSDALVTDGGAKSDAPDGSTADASVPDATLQDTGVDSSTPGDASGTSDGAPPLDAPLDSTPQG
jgi:hypothetical protein